MATWNAHCRVLDGMDVTREQHVERSKERARTLINVGRIREAVASMMMDMRKYPNCEVPHEIHAIGIYASTAGDVAGARTYIEGFN
jgi:predicted KAP-like P-loop ATPase